MQHVKIVPLEIVLAAIPVSQPFNVSPLMAMLVHLFGHAYHDVLELQSQGSGCVLAFHKIARVRSALRAALLFDWAREHRTFLAHIALT